MKRQLDCLCSFGRKDLLRESNFRAIDLSIPHVELIGFPINSANNLMIQSSFKMPEVDCFMTSPLCGIDSIGPICAMSCESGSNHPVYGFSHSVGRSISSVTVASLWLAYSSALLVAKIKLKANDEFVKARCFNNNILIDVSKHINELDIDSAMKKKAISSFEAFDIAPASAIVGMNGYSDNDHIWMSSWCELSEFMWNFPSNSYAIAAALDARFLSGSNCLSGHEAVFGMKVPLSVNRKQWTSRPFDINISFVDAACLKRSIVGTSIFVNRSGVFSINKSMEVGNSVEELWNDTEDFCHALFSDRIKWDYTKQAIKNWYTSMLRKYGNGK